jgi:hypothetical protein
MKNQSPQAASVETAADSSQPVLRSNSRRRFFRRAGGALVSAVAGAAALQADPLTAEAEAIGPLNPYQRTRRALQQRQAAALFQTNYPLPSHATNGDEFAYANRFASFSKTMPHNQLGIVDANAYDRYLTALRSGAPADFDRIPAGGTAKLVNPQAGICYDLEGRDIGSFEINAPPTFSSEAMAGEMVEVYWRALTRDIAFSQYETNAMIAAAVTDLRAFDLYAGVTPATLFRSGLRGDNAGYLVSQFLLKPYSVGATPIEQKYRLPVAGEDFMTGYAEWLAIQNGVAPTRRITFDAAPRYIRNGRDLGEYVHIDYSYQAYLNAALILNSFGAGALDAANPYKSNARQAGFATFGGPHIVDLVARVAALALKAAWFQKWYVHRRIRPEEFAGRLHNTKTNSASYPIHSKALNAAGTNSVFVKNGTYLLPMAYAEGCPAHPAMPGGHATIAGACTTILKAYFDENFVIPNPVIPSDDGATLNAFNGTLTIGDELNKLASNMSYGRDTSGMHWRSDEVEGLKLGEALAISVLTDFNGCFNENFEGFTLTKFDGTTLRISARTRSSTFGRVLRSF